MPDSSKGEGRKRTISAAHVLLLAVSVTAIGHGRALTAPFIWDDVYLFEQPSLHRPSNLWQRFNIKAWRNPRIDRYDPYRPFRDFTHTACTLVFGAKPWAFHLVSLLFHVGNALLVFLIGRMLFRSDRAGLLASMIFASLPAHVEAVTYAKNIAETQALFFALLTFMLSVRAIQRTRPSWALYVSAAACYVLAVLTKESAWPTPLLIAAWLLIARPRLCPRRRIRVAWVLVPLLLLAVLYAGLQLNLQRQGKASSFVTRATSLSPLSRVELASRTVLTYFSTLALPTWPRAWATLDMPEGPGAATACAGVVAALMVGLATRRRPVARAAFGLWWVVLALAPVSNLVAGHTARPLASQRLYTPSVGFALVLGALLAGWPVAGLGRRLRPIAHAMYLARLGVIAVVSGVALCWWNTGPWQSSLRFWRSAVRTCPRTARAQFNLGRTYADISRDALAVAQYRTARRLKPSHVDSIYNQANSLFRLGRTQDAEAAYRDVVAVSPDHYRAYNGLGASLGKQGRYAEAEKVFLRAREIDPTSPNASQGLMRIYRRAERFQDCVQLAREVLKSRPRDADLHLALGHALAKLGKTQEAVKSVEQAIQLGAGPRAERLLNILRSPKPGTDE